MATVVEAIASTIGYSPGIDGLLGSGLSKMLAFQQATDICKALGLPSDVDVDVVRRWGSGEVIHLGPEHLA
jgi:hypothetical protein